MNKVELRELCYQDEIGKYGIPASAEEYSDEKIRYLRISDIDDYGNLLNNDKKSVSSDEIEKYILKEGDIVFARTGNSTGRTYFHENKNGLLAFAGFLIKYGLDHNKVNPKYIKYFTISTEYKQWVKNLSVGSTRGNINAQTFASCPILLPKRSQQDTLVNILSSLDDKIEVNNKINAALEAMAKTLYDYWFVQFDFPNEEGKPYKSSGGKMVYNETLKREIPEGWEVMKFGEVYNISRGTLITKETSSIGNYKVVAAGLNYSYLTGDFNREKYTITVSGSGANAGYVNFWTERIFASDCTTVRGNSDSETFLGLQFLKLYQNYIFSLAKGSAQPHVYPSDIEGLYYVCPPDDLIDTFGKYSFNIYEKISNNLKQNQELAQLRDWLLPMLMNGQVSVADETEEVLRMIAEPSVDYKTKEDAKENRFALWLSNQKLAARGDIDEVILREIFDAMDDEDQ